MATIARVPIEVYLRSSYLREALFEVTGRRISFPIEEIGKLVRR